MRAYSSDLRERVLAACDALDGTREQIAARFSVSVAWIRKLLRLRRETGSPDPRPHGGGRPPAFDPAAGGRLREAVRADPDATLEELGKAAGVDCSPAAVFRALDRLDITRKKKTRRAAEQDRPELKAQRSAWREEFAAVDPERLVFLDESGATTAMDRTHGRAASGVRVDGPVPQGHWKVITLTAAVRLGGVPEAACLAFDGATDTVTFETYVRECLASALRPGDIVVMDNLSCHKTAEVARLIAEAGAEVRYLPAYSPDLNPIEKLFSKLKAHLRSAAARTVDGLIEAMGDALRAVRPGDILGWFAHSGYVPTVSTATPNRKPA
jgi:transposase